MLLKSFCGRSIESNYENLRKKQRKKLNDDITVAAKIFALYQER